VPDADRACSLVLGTILVEPLILALRRLAESEASARRLIAVDPSETDTRCPQPQSRRRVVGTGVRF
jgi:hypothetical protein